jgi:hypothetical protein
LKTTPKQRGGVTGKGFQPGASGNPGGRPKGFAARIKELTGGDDYPRIAEGFAVLAFGSPAERKKFFGEVVQVTARDRIAALIELRDSGPGRPAQTVIADTPHVPLFAMPNGSMPSMSKTSVPA